MRGSLGRGSVSIVNCDGIANCTTHVDPAPLCATGVVMAIFSDWATGVVIATLALASFPPKI